MCAESCHPQHIAENIPYGVAIRCRRLCSLDTDYVSNMNFLVKCFVNRGYDEKFVTDQFNKAKDLNRVQLINNNNNSKNKTNSFSNDRCFPLVTTFNPRLPNVSKFINKHKHILTLDSELSKLIQPDKVFASFRGCTTIGDTLISSRFPPKEINHGKTGCFRCDRSKCSVCDIYLKECSNFKSPHAEGTVAINKYLNCRTNYIIYFILDKICNRGYIGRSENNLYTRWTGHKSHIKTNSSKCNVAIHFNDPKSCIHNFNKKDIDSNLREQIEVFVIDSIDREPWDSPDSLFDKLSKREIFWQDRLRVMEEFGGLNTREERRVTQKRHSAK